jgi:hypothetical protein
MSDEFLVSVNLLGVGLLHLLNVGLVDAARSAIQR